MSKLSLALMVLAIGCASDEPTPSCVQAIGHYYEVGCAYYDTRTTPPTQLTSLEMTKTCQDLAILAPDQCVDEFDEWLTCNNDVKAPATSMRCDCSARYIALLRCD